MVKVTPNETLVPCKDAFVKGNPNSCLTRNVLHARKLIRAAKQSFFLKRNACIFSGYICEFEEGFFIFNIWEGQTLYRSLTVAGVGYSGALHVHIQEGQAAQTVGFDIQGMIAARPGPLAMAMG